MGDVEVQLACPVSLDNAVGDWVFHEGDVGIAMVLCSSNGVFGFRIASAPLTLQLSAVQ
jgi:hypothetical protein